MRLSFRFRWTWLLPGAMLVVTTVLMMVSVRQETEFWAARRGFTDTPGEIQQPARLFVELLNGPGFFLSFWIPDVPAFAGHDSGRLFGVAFFWGVIGWLLDRCRQGVTAPIIGVRWIRVVLYSFLLAISIFFIYAILLALQSQGMLSTQFLLILKAFGLRTIALANCVALIWAGIGAAYFGRKLLSTVRRRPENV